MIASSSSSPAASTTGLLPRPQAARDLYLERLRRNSALESSSYYEDDADYEPYTAPAEAGAAGQHSQAAHYRGVMVQSLEKQIEHDTQLVYQPPPRHATATPAGVKEHLLSVILRSGEDPDLKAEQIELMERNLEPVDTGAPRHYKHSYKSNEHWERKAEEDQKRLIASRVVSSVGSEQTQRQYAAPAAASGGGWFSGSVGSSKQSVQRATKQPVQQAKALPSGWESPRLT